MGLFRSLLGIALVMVAWFNPLGIDLYLRILMFILGFDMMSIVLKVGIFVIGFFGVFPGVTNLGFTLLILMAVEIITTLLIVGLIARMILKPLAVFVVAFLAGISLQPSLIVAAIDLILNLDVKK